MANIKITDLNAAGSLAATDVVPVVDVSADETKKITATDLFRTLPDGTAAAPSLSFASDPDLGLYRTGANGLAISTGGTQRVTVDGSGNVTISGDLTVSGATTTVESTTVTIDDKNIELGSVASPSNTTADGGGITLKGATDKTIKWINSTGYWTFNTGIEVGGHLQIDDNNEIRVGTGQDLTIQHNASDSIIDNNTGNLFIRTLANDNDVNLQSDNGSGGVANYVKCDGSAGAVRLYHYGTEKLNTKSDGVDVIGEVQCDSLDVDGGADITGNVVLHNHLDLGDDNHIRVGAGDDLKIYHNGTNSYIKEEGTGELRLGSNNRVRITKHDSETLATFTVDGGCELYHDNSVKIDTVSGGARIHGYLSMQGSGGHVYLPDDAELKIGNGEDLRIYHDGSESVIRDSGTGQLKIRTNLLRINNAADSETIATFNENGAVSLYYDNSKKFETKSDGIDVTGEVQCDSLDVDGVVDITGNVTLHANLDLQDDDQLNIGSGNDFTIRHNGTDSIFENDTGHLYISNYANDKGIFLRSDDGSGAIANYIYCDGSNGQVTLYHYGSGKANTKSDGLNVTGELECDSLDVDGNADITGDISISGGNKTVKTTAGFLQVGTTGSNHLAFLTNGSERGRVDSSGRLLLGTTTEGNTAADDLTIATSGHTGMTIRSGTSHEGGIYFSDGTSGNSEYRGYVYYRHSDDSLLIGTAATERFRILSTGAWSIEGASNYGTSGQVLTSNGNDAPTWQTPSSAGGATAITMNDGVKVNFGASNDLQIYHSGSHSFIDDTGTGQLAIRSSEISFEKYTGEQLAMFTADDSCELYYNNSKKFDTVSGGARIHGYLSMQGSGGHIYLPDSAQLKIGNGEDLKIYHNGTNSEIVNGTGYLKVTGQNGDLYLQSNSDVWITSHNAGETMARFIKDGASELYFNNSRKFTTNSGGIDITGEVQCDSLDVDGAGDITGTLTLHGNLDMQDNDVILLGSGDDLQIYHSGSNSYIAELGTGGLINLTSTFSVRNAADTEQMVLATQDAGVELFYNNSKKFETTSNGVGITGFMQCDNPGVYLDGLDWTSSNKYMHNGYQFWQVGSNWNNTTGTFTCPVAGKYFVAADAQGHNTHTQSGASGQYANILPRVNNSNVGLEAVATTRADGGTGGSTATHTSFGFAIILDCNANDTIRVYSNHGFRTNTQNHLTIYLLG